MSWKDREIERFVDGTYAPLPSLVSENVWFPRDHFVHRAIKSDDLTMIAYTPSEEYGEADRQVSLRFGKYLKKVFPEMTDKRIQELTIKLRGIISEELEGDLYTLEFTTDADKISDIFETEMGACDSSNTSCMHGKFTSWDYRPYHVYANSPDVALAYLEQNGNILARTVVSTKDKHYVRLYSVRGQECLCEHLKTKLQEAGYSHGTLEGNRLSKLPEKGNCQVLPYIDPHGQFVSDRGKYWEVTGNRGEYQCDETEGLVREDGPRCDCCEELESNCDCYYCDCCESRSVDGCERCRMCEHCERCIPHDNCNCDRCSECHKLLESYDGCQSCECDRCPECSELESECECVKCDECGRLTEDCECEENRHPCTDSEAQLILPLAEIQNEQPIA